jgi:hypothetical protein
VIGGGTVILDSLMARQTDGPVCLCIISVSHDKIKFLDAGRPFSHEVTTATIKALYQDPEV